MKLTIVIPTWNRPRQIAHTLSLLIPQLTDECYLIVIDNHSDRPVIEIAGPMLKDVPPSRYEIQRNPVNIGGNPNIMRSFEGIKTEWLWTLGDDDEIVPDAIKIILEDIHANPDMTYINYYSPHDVRPFREKTIRNVGRREFLSNIDSLGSMIFMSCNVYNLPKVIGMYWQANSNTYSCTPQWLILFHSVHDESITIYSSRIVCLNPVEDPGNLDVSLNVARGLATLLDLPFRPGERAIFRNLLRRDIKFLASVDSIIKKLIIDHFVLSPRPETGYQFRRYYHTLYRYIGWPSILKWHIYHMILLVSPKLLFSLIRQLYLKKRGVDLLQFLPKTK